jgi:transposase-like protein
MPQDRDGGFSTELFERYQRSEQALVATLAEMYVQGVSTRKVKAITEERCGHAFSTSAISPINKRPDEGPMPLRPRAEPFAYSSWTPVMRKCQGRGQHSARRS